MVLAPWWYYHIKNLRRKIYMICAVNRVIKYVKSGVCRPTKVFRGNTTAEPQLYTLYSILVVQHTRG